MCGSKSPHFYQYQIEKWVEAVYVWTFIGWEYTPIRLWMYGIRKIIHISRSWSLEADQVCERDKSIEETKKNKPNSLRHIKNSTGDKKRKMNSID